MAAPARLVAPTIERLRTLLKQIEDGELLVPNFQRDFVWRDAQRLELLDSIRQGLPIGSILVWRTKKHRLLSKDRVGLFPAHPPPEHGPYQYVLDGMQRLATLYGALWGRTSEALLDGEQRWPILFDLEQEIFRLPPRRGAAPLTCIELWRLFDGRAFYEFEKRMIEAGREVERRRAGALQDIFTDYVVPIIPIQSEDLEQVTEAFRRVSNQGTKMNELHMVNAVGKSSDVDIGRELDRIADDLATLGWESIDRQVILNAAKMAVGIDYYRADPQEIRRKIQSEPRLTDELSLAMQRAVRFLGRDCGVAGPPMLPYDPQLVLLAEAARVAGVDFAGEVADRLRAWFWQTTYAEYFTGATNSKLRRARAHVVDIVLHGAESIPPAIDPRVEPLVRPRANSVRTTAFLLFLATMKPCSLDGELPAAKLLARGGLGSVAKIIHEREVGEGIDTGSAANRWLVPPEQADVVREAIVRGQGTLSVAIERLLDGHAFSLEAADCLARGDWQGMLDARGRELRAREAAFVRSLGLECDP